MPYKDPNDPRRKENARAATRRWREANPERRREHERAQYERTDPAKRLETQRAYRRANPEKYRAWNAARKARKLGQFIENVDPKTVYEMHGGMCGICEEFIEGDFHVDHVIPLAKGGMHGYVNVQPAHPTCNLRKGARV